MTKVRSSADRHCFLVTTFAPADDLGREQEGEREGELTRRSFDLVVRTASQWCAMKGGRAACTSSQRRHRGRGEPLAQPRSVIAPRSSQTVPMSQRSGRRAASSRVNSSMTESYRSAPSVAEPWRWHRHRSEPTISSRATSTSRILTVPPPRAGFSARAHRRRRERALEADDLVVGPGHLAGDQLEVGLASIPRLLTPHGDCYRPRTTAESGGACRSRSDIDVTGSGNEIASSGSSNAIDTSSVGSWGRSMR